MAKKHLDLSQLAKSIVDKATGENDGTENVAPEKNPGVAALGRLGVRKGGKR